MAESTVASGSVVSAVAECSSLFCVSTRAAPGWYRSLHHHEAKVELDPETGKGRAELLYLPKETALAGDPENAASSFTVVAGARYAPEKKTSARILDFDFEREHIRIVAEIPAEIAISRLAA